MHILVTGGSGFIGTNLIDTLLEEGVSIINLDINPPKKSIHKPYWQECDILDFDKTLKAFEKFRPTHVIHLAARTDTNSDDIDEYKANTEGTINVLNCIKSIPQVKRVIITSSQFVFGPPGLPKHDEDYKPIGAYGMSKVLSEKATQTADLECIWTIIRPTNVWGPWHPRYPKEFWLVLRKGLYVHPSGKPAIRCYGYVKNVIFQMIRILNSPKNLVDRSVFYLGDPPIPLIKWADGFSVAVTGKPVKIVPRWFIKLLAGVGSLVSKFGISFPITLSRYVSMTQDYITPVEDTIKRFGQPPYFLEEGIDETVIWLNQFWNENAI